MRRVFADTLYFIAVLDARDPWHAAAMRAAHALGTARVITTDAVLLEVANAFSEVGATMRRDVARTIHDVLTSSATEVVPQDRDRFLAGLDFYERRPDKEYSLTDCISMLVMRERRLTEVLTNDHHFEQEGFRVLIPER